MMKNRVFIIISLGQGLLLRLPFADNGVLSGRRTFLVIEEGAKDLYLLNVSSLNGKEHKLIIDSNEEIIKYNPPFNYRSFVKFDALYKVEKCNELNTCILSNKRKLEEDELSRLMELYSIYKSKHEIFTSITSAEQLREYLAR